MFPSASFLLIWVEYERTKHLETSTFKIIFQGFDSCRKAHFSGKRQIHSRTEGARENYWVNLADLAEFSDFQFH